MNHACQPGRAPLNEHPSDCYDTPPEAVRALLRMERLPRRIYEPACGKGNIVRVLRDAGYDVTASDLNDRGCPESKSGIDFLLLTKTTAPTAEMILTNPPFALAEQFIIKALELYPQVIMLLRLAFLESERRSRILENNGLVCVYVFRNRLPMMHRVGYDGPRSTSSMPFAWFCWHRDYKGPIELERLSWKVES